MTALSHSNPRLTITAISLGVFASVMSTTMLSLAFVDITRTFGISLADLQWRNGLFFTFFAVGLPFFGKLADRIGLRRQFFIGLGLFTLASLCSGLTRSWPAFLAFQTLQAIADSMIVPALMGLIRVVFPENKIGWAFGWFGGVLSVSTLVGPLLGGLLLTHAEWPALCWSLSALSAICLLASSLIIPPQPRAGRPSLAGLPHVSTVCLLTLVLCAQGAAWNWPLSVRLSLACAGGVAGVLLLANERRVAPQAALFPRGALSNPTFLTGCGRVFLLFLATNTVGLFVPSYLRQVHSLDADQVGQLLLVQPLVALPLAGWAGRAADARPRLCIVSGLLLLAGGFLSFLLSLSPPAHLALLIGTFITLAIGSTLIMPSQDKLALLCVPANESGHYMGIFQMVQFGSGAFVGALFGPLIEGGSPGMLSASGFAAAIVVNTGLILLATAMVWLEQVLLRRRAGSLALNGPAAG